MKISLFNRVGFYIIIHDTTIMTKQIILCDKIQFLCSANCFYAYKSYYSVISWYAPKRSIKFIFLHSILLVPTSYPFGINVVSTSYPPPTHIMPTSYPPRTITCSPCAHSVPTTCAPSGMHCILCFQTWTSATRTLIFVTSCVWTTKGRIHVCVCMVIL